MKKKSKVIKLSSDRTSSKITTRSNLKNEKTRQSKIARKRVINKETSNNSKISNSRLDSTNKKVSINQIIQTKKDQQSIFPESTNLKAKKISIKKTPPKENQTIRRAQNRLRRNKKEIEIVIENPKNRRRNNTSNIDREVKNENLAVNSKKSQLISKKKEIQILIDSPVKKKQQILNEKKSTSKTKQRIKMLFKSEEVDDDFIKKIRSKDNTKKVDFSNKKIPRGRKQIKEISNIKSDTITPKKNRERTRDLESEGSVSMSQRKPKIKVVPSIRTPTKIFEKDKSPSDSSSEIVEKGKKFIARRTIPNKNLSKEIKEEVDSDSSGRKDSKVEEKEKEAEKSSSKPKIVTRKGAPVNQILGATNTQAISEEIQKIIKKIQERKKNPEIKKPEPVNKTRITRGKKTAPTTAKIKSGKEYNFILQRNSNVKVHHIVKIEDLSCKEELKNSDVILVILEIANNSDYYKLNYFSNLAENFWKDIKDYEEMKNILKKFKSDTLKKYWRDLNSLNDPNTISDLIKSEKKYIDSLDIKVGLIIKAIKLVIKEKHAFREALDIVSNIHTTKKVLNKVTHEKEEMGDSTKKKNKKLVITTKIKNTTKKFIGNNVKGEIDEIYDVSKCPFSKFKDYHNRTNDEESSKFQYLNKIIKEKKTEILNVLEEDKYIFNVMDNILEQIEILFPYHNKKFIMEALDACSWNLENTLVYLEDPQNKQGLIFTVYEDNLITNGGKNEEYKSFTNKKGLSRVQERQDYLLG